LESYYGCDQLVLRDNCRTLVYIEGDATMNTYNDADGKPRTALNLVQRKFLIKSHYTEFFTNISARIEKLEVLSPKKSSESS